MLVCLCVCVRALYVDGWCTGLEGKRSRLLSLRTCQSSAERNQKESKSQHWARVCVCTRVCVCMKCIQPLGYSQKQVRRETCENGGRLWCCVKAHCPPVVFSCFTTADDTDVWCECLEVEADLNTTGSLSRSLWRLEDGKICKMCFLNVKIWHVVNSIEDEDV